MFYSTTHWNSFVDHCVFSNQNTSKSYKRATIPVIFHRPIGWQLHGTPLFVIKVRWTSCYNAFKWKTSKILSMVGCLFRVDPLWGLNLVLKLSRQLDQLQISEWYNLCWSKHNTMPVENAWLLLLMINSCTDRMWKYFWLITIICPLILSTLNYF